MKIIVRFLIIYSSIIAEIKVFDERVLLAKISNENDYKKFPIWNIS